MIGKIHMSQYDVYNSYKKTYFVSNCSLQHLLKFLEPQGYNAGKFGWNCDFYLMPMRETAIVSGDRFRKNIPTIPYKMTKKYDSAALEILKMSDLSNADKSIKLFSLIEKMLAEFEKTLKI